jgi:hypothetical protein
MTKEKILTYIKNIKLIDIINYCFKEGIKIDNTDLHKIYASIKDNSEDIIDNPLKVINNLQVSNDIHNKLLELYNRYKFLLDKIKEK